MDKAEARLQARVASRFRLETRTVTLPWSSCHYRITLPASFDSLLDAAADDPEQHLPYWAALWPSGIALADVILSRPVSFEGQAVLELGCGAGVTATAALAAGARLLVTDYAPDSLLLCRLNTLANVGCEPSTLQLNWREPSGTLFHLAEPRFPAILAADVLYETRDIAPLLDLLARLLAPGGTLWLAEPGRPTARQFMAEASTAGWHDDVVEHRGPWPDPEDEGVVVRVHRLRRPD
jgi:predicted nicotinamide N-methyase